MSNTLIARVKQYRARHGCTLKEAHDAVTAGRDMADFSQPLHPPAMPDELSRFRAENERLREGGVGAIAAERKRQIEQEGWTPEHDDQHTEGEMARAAACYAIRSAWGWPSRWDRRWWKPKDRRHDLVKAGALIAAEIDRLDRARKALEGGE